MKAADPNVLANVRSLLERQKLQSESVEEPYCTRFVVRNGATVAHISAYNTDRIVVGGKDSLFAGCSSGYDRASKGAI
jgi:hypothetical protein